MPFRRFAAIWAACAALFLACLLLDCGGGGDGPVASGVIQPAAPARTDLLFGYYGDCPTCALETADHSNLYWAANWAGFPATLQSLFNARAAGFRNIVLAVPAYESNAELEVRFYLTSLKQAGYLVNIAALYPIDEPDVHGKTEDQVLATNAMLRRVMADYPELAATRLAVIYGANSTFPGVASYDWVGFDDYSHGCSALGAPYAAMKGRLRADQRILVVPGGADPWRQDPACFIARANADPQVVAVVAFIWFDSWGGTLNLGIRSNPTKKLYCEAGRRIVGNQEPC